jgi:hypothetical protein
MPATIHRGWIRPFERANVKYTKRSKRLRLTRFTLLAAPMQIGTGLQPYVSRFADDRTPKTKNFQPVVRSNAW